MCERIIYFYTHTYVHVSKNTRTNHICKEWKWIKKKKKIANERVLTICQVSRILCISNKLHRGHVSTKRRSRKRRIRKNELFSWKQELTEPKIKPASYIKPLIITDCYSINTRPNFFFNTDNRCQFTLKTYAIRHWYTPPDAKRFSSIMFTIVLWSAFLWIFRHFHFVVLVDKSWHPSPKIIIPISAILSI